jgi:two-component system sensor histidine kinase DesK
MVSAVAWFAALLALGFVMVPTLGQIGTTATVYLAVMAVMAVMLFPPRAALVLVLLDAALLVVVGETRAGWSSGVGLAFPVLAMYGIQQILMHNRALVSAHAENAELAVENERTRFARDLHGILGHSLTVITVKAELAQRLLDVDPEGTRRELSDLEGLSRDALGDVRRAVEGYRELTLPGELARARIALAAATESLFAGESPLTAREIDVLQAARGGATISAVARALFLSEGTVRNHLSSAIGKTGAADRAEAVTIAEGNGWL